MIQLEGGSVRLDEEFAVVFQRTLRVPDDGRTYPLPPGLGALPAYPVADFAARLPADVSARGGVFIPMYQREALWLGFRTTGADARALAVAVGGYNVLSGAARSDVLRAEPQDYLVCPPQLWLDGVRTRAGQVRQFVAEPLGRGATLEASLGGVERRGGLQLRMFRPYPGAARLAATAQGPMRARAPNMGFGLGGSIAQKIYPDPYGVAAWDPGSGVSLDVHVLNSAEFRAATGLEPPPSPVDATTYAERGLPWFELYDEAFGDLSAPDVLRDAPTLAEHDASDRRAPDPSLADRELVVRRIEARRPGKA